MNRAALFDLDGTLIDSVADIAAAVNAALTEFGHAAHPLAAYYEFVGEGVEALITRAMAPAVFDPAVLARYRELYAAEMTKRTQPYPGIHAMLRSLQAEGWQLAVLSNKPHQATCLLVKHFFEDIAFGAVAGQRPELPRKPDPTAALALAASLGVEAKRCLFIGDTAIDLQTARHAGMEAIGVAWGFRPGEMHSADAVASTAAELLAELRARAA